MNKRDFVRGILIGIVITVVGELMIILYLQSQMPYNYCPP